MERLDEPRVRQATHASVADLCRIRPERGFATWTLGCRRPEAVAAALRAEPLLADTRLSGRVVRLPHAWRRFPQFLESVTTSVPGVFRVASRSAGRIVARRGRDRLVFLRLEAHAAAAAFRRGLVHEAPVPVGDLAFQRRRGSVRVTQLLGVDLVDLGGALARFPGVRRVLFDTAERATYRDLVSERAAPTTVSLLRRGGDVAPDRFREARESVPRLPRVGIRLARPADPRERYAATVLLGHWRNVQLGASFAARGPVRVRRVVARYDAAEALLLAALPRSGAVRAILGLQSPAGALERVDRRLRARADLIPLAWVADARLVSRCLRGWREDRLGRVDYTRVRRAGSCG